MVRKKTKTKKPTRKTRKNPQLSTYEAKDIYVLQGLEPVRRRPGMYIGSTGIEGLHRLIYETVGNSVTYQTPIIFENQGKIQIEQIGKLIDQFFKENQEKIERSESGDTEILRKSFNLKALSFAHSNYKLSYQPIFSLIRHKVNSDIYRITLQNNREVEITPHHSLFTPLESPAPWGGDEYRPPTLFSERAGFKAPPFLTGFTLQEGKVVPIKGTEINIGTPIVVPKNWPEVKNPQKEIDLTDELLKLSPKNTKSINLYNLTSLLKNDEILSWKIKKEIPQWTRTKNGNLRHRSNLWQDYLRFNYLSFNFIRNLDKKEIEKIKRVVLIGNRRHDNWKIKSKIKIDKNLVELLGIFAAEGTIEKDKRGYYKKVVFSFGSKEKELINFTSRLIEKVFRIKPILKYTHESARTLNIYSSLIGLIFKEVIRTGENSSNKKVPNLIFNLNRELRERYLISYLAGDGYPTEVWTRYLIQNTIPSNEEKRKFTLVTKNRYLASNLSYLLSSLNKTYSCGKRKRKKGKKFVKVTYKEREKYTEIKSQKFSYALDFYWDTNSSYINYLPSREIISKVLWGWPHTFSLNFYGNGGITPSKVLSLLEKQKLILYQGALDFLNSDLGILRVKKIEKIKYKKPYVYDISVPNGENFVAGFSPILAHNSIDEAIMGYCNEIKVSFLPKNRIKVEDNGRGIPVERHPQTKKSALETVMTTLHAGAKFGGKVYASTGGLHGVGVSAVCALSDWMRVEVCRSGFKFAQEYSKGKPKTKVKKIGKSRQTGTIVSFEPDPEIFRAIKFDPKRILNYLRQQAYLTKGVKITFADLRSDQKSTFSFYFEGGLSSYVKYLTQGTTPRHPNIFYGSGERNGILVEAALRYTDEYECYEESFANNVYTEDGGSHLTGFRTALTRTLNDYAKKNGFLKETDDNLSGEDVREGLTGVISVKIKEPQFEGQTKAKLGNPEAKIAVEQVVSETLTDFLERNPLDARAIIENCLTVAKARKAAKAARETVLRKGVLEGLALPGKLADCSSRNPEESELYIVEGESAGGSGKQARDRRFQAILPLRGKILNVERARLDKILASKEIKSLIIALGTAIAEDFNIEKARYHRIILMMDADVDGQHLVTLLLTLFYRYFKPIIEKGYLYIAQPPLYKIQAGKKIEYAYLESDKAEILSAMQKQKVVPSIQRYKGLGEMNASELWETAMNPENRILLQVNIESAREADKIFDILMGEEVLPRKKFIQTYAKKVRNLDI